MKNLFIICLVGIFMFSCAALKPQEDMCSNLEAKDSAICYAFSKMGVSVKDANLLFKFVNLELLRKDAYTKEQCLGFLERLDNMLETETYDIITQEIIFATGALNSKYSLEIMLLSEYFDMFTGVNLKVNEFDKGLLHNHINQQRNLINMVD
jgi:hypothetical protein